MDTCSWPKLIKKMNWPLGTGPLENDTGQMPIPIPYEVNGWLS